MSTIFYCGHYSLLHGNSVTQESISYETSDYLFENGRVQNKDGIDKWLTSALSATNEPNSCIFLDSPSATTTSRSFLSQLAFEKLNLDQIQFLPKTFCCLKEFNLENGIVLRSGDAVTEIAVYQNSNLVQHKSFAFGGKQISHLFYDLLPKKQKTVEEEWTEKQFRTKVDAYKHLYCYVASDYFTEYNNYKKNGWSDEIVELQDASCSFERFLCTESLFNPSLANSYGIFKSLQDCIVQTIEEVDPQLQPMMIQNICLGGGNLFTKGCAFRIFEEVVKSRPQWRDDLIIQDRVVDAKQIWKRACLVDSTNSKHWISKKAYEEHGDQLLQHLQI